MAGPRFHIPGVTSFPPKIFFKIRIFSFKAEIFPTTDLSAGWFPEEGRLNPVSLGSVLVLHGEPDMVGLLTVFVPHHHLVVTRVVVGQMSEIFSR